VTLLVEAGRDQVAELEHLMFHPTPADLGPIYSVALVDKRWTILARKADGSGFTQVYCPPDFLHRYGRERAAIDTMAEQMNQGSRTIDVIMAHEATYNPRTAEPC
jgi:hypothetical protein